MDPTKKKVTKTVKNRRTGEKKTITKTIPVESLFNLFESKKLPEIVRDRTDDDVGSDDDKILL